MESDTTSTTGTKTATAGTNDVEETQVWMVERTYSADSPNILVVVYATLDGTRYLQKEWAFNRYGSSPGPTVTAARDVETARLSAVEGPDTQDRYRTEAERMRERHDPDDTV
jgi:hypothetical protein